MAQLVVMGAMATCSFGAAPTSLVALPTNMVLGTGPPAMTIMDIIPIVNVPPFAVCQSPSNPTVAAATAAAWGVLTPMPCMPVIPAPWAPGAPTVMIGNFPALDSTSKCMCTWGGVIQITVPGEFTIEVP